MTEKYKVLISGYQSNRTFSVVEVSDESYLSRRQRLSMFIPDAGSENAAVRVTRLLNQENDLMLELRAKREAEDEAGREAAVAHRPVPKIPESIRSAVEQNAKA